MEPSPDFNGDRGMSDNRVIPRMTIFNHLDCDSLRKAIKGAGANESIIVDILGNRSTDQRVNIRDKYKSLFNRVRREFI